MNPMYVILDPGHGGIVNGKYVTPGKRSPAWPDLAQLFEGVQNRKIVARIKDKLANKDIPFLDVVDSETDILLSQRVNKANEAFRDHPEAIYVSVHADAAGDGVTHHNASGISVWTSRGETKSDLLAEAVILGLSFTMKGRTNFRADKSDGDRDYESDFYVLHKTKMPAILCELGFMTNRQECEKMMTDAWIDEAAAGIVEGILTYYNKNRS